MCLDRSLSHFLAMQLLLILSFLVLSVLSSPVAAPLSAIFDRGASSMKGRDQPYFPSQPPSCPICEANYATINSCAGACPIFDDPSEILLDPPAFVSLVECSCTDTFQSAFPQCVDCFIKTNQTQVLNTSSLPSAVNGMRELCTLASTLFGNVSAADNETVSASPSATAPAAAMSTSDGCTLSFASYLLVIVPSLLLCTFV